MISMNNTKSNTMFNYLLNTKLIKTLARISKKYPRLSSLLVFIITVSVVSYIFYIRFPNNLLHPNFYAEDGKDYMANILNNGFLTSLFHTFNGYFIVGIYLLMGVAYAINFIIFQNQFIFDHKSPNSMIIYAVKKKTRLF